MMREPTRRRPCLFQSAPGGEAGGKSRCPRDVSSRRGFNPPPAVRPGERLTVRDRAAGAGAFQSAPGGEAGGKRGSLRWTSCDRWRFNPPPAVRPGESDGPHTYAIESGFNPPPAVRPGERPFLAYAGCGLVSIRPRR